MNIWKALITRFPKEIIYSTFEKVSKRTYLDIATVNSAILISVSNRILPDEINISAGGVSATPLYLFQTCDYLNGKKLNVANIKDAVSILQSEISQ